MKDYQPKNSGLRPTKRDPRDFSHSKTFGAVKDEEIPNEYIIEPLKIKDQLYTDFCTGYGSAASNEDQEEVEFSGDWQMAKIKQLLRDWKGYGSDLRTPCKALVKFGSLPQDKAPFNLETNDRDFLANWNNWPADLDLTALPYRKGGFFAVDKLPKKDLFDSIKNALWQNRLNRRSIITGVVWHQEWTLAEKGIVPEIYFEEAGLHCIKLIGFRGEYIGVQNSYGTDVGDGGIFWFPRSVVNKEFSEPLFMLRDLGDGEEPKPIGNIFEILIFKIINFFKNL